MNRRVASAEYGLKMIVPSHRIPRSVPREHLFGQHIEISNIATIDRDCAIDSPRPVVVLVATVIGMFAIVVDPQASNIPRPSGSVAGKVYPRPASIPQGRLAPSQQSYPLHDERARSDHRPRIPPRLRTLRRSSPERTAAHQPMCICNCDLVDQCLSVRQRDLNAPQTPSYSDRYRGIAPHSGPPVSQSCARVTSFRADESL